jgi:hypothetical protein
MASKGGAENKAGAPAPEQKTDAPRENEAGGESYEQKAARGRHGIDNRFPHPFGERLPDLGEVPTK